MKDFSKWLIAFGIFATIIGFILNVFADKLGWFYFPFASLVLLNLLIYIVMRIINWLK